MDVVDVVLVVVVVVVGVVEVVVVDVVVDVVEVDVVVVDVVVVEVVVVGPSDMNDIWSINTSYHMNWAMRKRVFGHMRTKKAQIWPRGYKTFFMLNPSMKFHLVIKIKIPRIKTCFMLNSAEHAQLSWAWKKF